MPRTGRTVFELVLMIASTDAFINGAKANNNENAEMTVSNGLIVALSIPIGDAIIDTAVNLSMMSHAKRPSNPITASIAGEFTLEIETGKRLTRSHCMEKNTTAQKPLSASFRGKMTQISMQAIEVATIVYWLLVRRGALLNR